MPNPRDTSMLVRAATLYYLDGLSQAEVASRIGVTRSNVSRVLSDARRLGIVEITVNDPFGRSEGLERQLRDRFGLRECLVAPTGSADAALPRVGTLGAEWLVGHLPEHGSIAVSWGSAVQALVDAVSSPESHPELEVLPLVGGLSNVDSTRDANVLVRLLAARLGCVHRRLYAPAVVESSVTREAFLAEPAIGEVLQAARGASIAIVGIGSAGSGASSAIVDSMHLDHAERATFEAMGAVGDCCTRFFDRDGVPVRSSVDERVIAIDLPELLEIPTVMGIAAGRAKAPGVHAALNGHFFDVLAIDSELAEALLVLPAPRR